MNGVRTVDKLGPAPPRPRYIMANTFLLFCSSREFYFTFTDFVKKAKEVTEKREKYMFTKSSRLKAKCSGNDPDCIAFEAKRLLTD